MKYKIQLEMGAIGIIEGQHKRSLECYIDERLFTQRKTYDEYYLSSKSETVELGLQDLMILAESFKVKVFDHFVSISSLDY